MRKYVFLFIAVFIFAGWGWLKSAPPAVKIGPINISAEEFEDALSRSPFPKDDPVQREAFLDSFIARKLILMEAEKQGLDKDPEFLSSLQLFWEQSLLKLMIAKKMDEITGSIKVSPSEVNKYYIKHMMEFGDRPVAEVQGQIKLILFKEKQRVAVEEWTDLLRENTPVIIDDALVGIAR